MLVSKTKDGSSILSTSAKIIYLKNNNLKYKMVTISSIMIFIIILLTITYCLQTVYKYYSNKKWQSRPIRNFKFNHRGKDFWYSRACTVTLFVFSKNSEGEWCVLANKRGDKVPDYSGYWNVPCGYIDFDENGEQAAQRECYEETNVFIPLNEIKFHSAHTSPTANRQNISLHYVSNFNDDDLTSIDLTNENSEVGEVADIQWIPIANINNYNWAFGHDTLLKRLAKQKLN